MKNLKTNLKSLKGITLVSLIVTIIILLILSGIAIATLMGENGLFAKVKLSKEKYSISEAKEKLELAISTLQIEQEGKGENLKKEDLPKMNNDEIDVRDTSNFPVKVICNNYEFNIDSNFVISYVGIADETIVTYTTEPEGYTNKNEVKILIKIKNSKGIKSVECPNDNDKLLANGQTEIGFDYKVTANGTYTFKIVDNDNKEISKDIVIDKIDTVEPKNFSPISKNIMIENFTILVNVEDGNSTATSVKSGIEKYEYYVKEKSDLTYTKYESNNKEYTIDGLSAGKEYNVYVIAYDKAGNSTTSSTLNVTTYNTPLPPVAKITFNEKNATEKVLDYPILTLDGIKNCMLEPNLNENVTLEITSPNIKNIKYYYSLDGGNSWNEYTYKVNTTYQADDLIQVKSSYITDSGEIYSLNSNIKKYLYDNTKEITASDGLKKEAYDNNYATYTDCDTDNNYLNKLIIYPECWGKYITLYTWTADGSGYGCISMFSSTQTKDVIISDYLWRLSGDISSGKKTAKSIKMPQNIKMISLTDGTSRYIPFYVYEVKCTDEDLSCQEF